MLDPYYSADMRDHQSQEEGYYEEEALGRLIQGILENEDDLEYHLHEHYNDAGTFLADDEHLQEEAVQDDIAGDLRDLEILLEDYIKAHPRLLKDFIEKERLGE